MSNSTIPTSEPNENKISEAQLAANRGNSQKSTGPKTEAGKKRSSINATRHGLTGQFHAFSAEDQIAFDLHCASLLADLQPATYREKILAISIAEDQWRLSRARALENNIFTLGVTGAIGDATDANTPEVHTAISQARVWLTDGHKIQLLALYESRVRRTLEKNEKQLAELQALRVANQDKTLEQAKLFIQFARMKGQTYDLASDFPLVAGKTLQDGFEFSTPQIERLINRDQRLIEAMFYSKKGWQLRFRTQIQPPPFLSPPESPPTFGSRPTPKPEPRPSPIPDVRRPLRKGVGWSPSDRLFSVSPATGSPPPPAPECSAAPRWARKPSGYSRPVPAA